MSAAAESPIAALARGQTVCVDTEGGSMFPVIRHGDRVTVAPFRRDPRVGDVVLAVVGGTWVLHRIVAVSARDYMLRGDNRADADLPLSRAQIVGHAQRTQRGTRSMPLDWPESLGRLWVRVSPLSARVVGAVERLRRVRRGR